MNLQLRVSPDLSDRLDRLVRMRNATGPHPRATRSSVVRALVLAATADLPAERAPVRATRFTNPAPQETK